MESTINIDLLEGFSDEEKLEARGELLALHFMTYINHKMEQKGITKKELAEMVGTSPSYITQLFRGDKTPNWKMIAKMERALEISFKIGCEGLDVERLPEVEKKTVHRAREAGSMDPLVISPQNTSDYIPARESSHLSNKKNVRSPGKEGLRNRASTRSVKKSTLKLKSK